MKTKELAVIAEQALVFTIAHEEDMKQATTILSKLNQFNDNIIEEREKVTKPLNEALKAERLRWKPLELQNQAAIDAVRAEMTRYQTHLANQRKAEEERIAGLVASGKIKKIETAVKHIDALDKVVSNISTDSGDVKFRATPTLKVTDIEKIAREYFDLSEARLLKALKDGTLVEGAEIEIMQIPVNYRA